MTDHLKEEHTSLPLKTNMVHKVGFKTSICNRDTIDREPRLGGHMNISDFSGMKTIYTSLKILIDKMESLIPFSDLYLAKKPFGLMTKKAKNQ